MTTTATRLRVLIAIHFVWTILLTPIAFEPRPFSSFTALGFVSLALIFTTVALDVAAFVLAARRSMTAGAAAVIGAVFFVPAFAVDQLGYFSSQRAPAQITILEVAALLTQLAILYAGWRLRREAASAVG
jgi:hypothetical protein